MKIPKKIAAVLAAVFLASAPMNVSAAHDFYPSAETVMSGYEYTCTMHDTDETHMYKATLSDDGVLTVKLACHTEYSGLTVTDADGGLMHPYRASSNSGKAAVQGNGRVNFRWDDENGYYSGTVKYSLEKGNYYIVLHKNTNSAGGDFSMTAEFPEKKSKMVRFDESAAVEVDDDEMTAGGRTDRVFSMTVEISPGRTLNMSTILGIDDVTDEYIRWYTSDRSVVTVDKKGKIRAKSVGNAMVTVYIGDEMTLIFVNVSE